MIGGLVDWRIGGLEDWWIGGLVDWVWLTQRRREAESAEGIGELRLRTMNSSDSTFPLFHLSTFPPFH